MIVVGLKGGVGNQLFQWAFGKNLSNILNVPLFLDLSLLNKNILNVTKRNFCLDKFPNIHFKIINPEDIKNYNFNIINDDNVFYNNNYFSDQNYYLDGFFQSQNFFKKSIDLIKNKLKPEITFIERMFLEYPLKKNTTSLHIRRTDYLKSNGYHTIQPISYYNNALNIIGDYENIFIFSDDIQWCKHNLNFSNMVFIENLDDIENIWLMSMCKYNIIANSTFSWWGAWLNQNDGKKIISPKTWYGQQASNLLDKLIPSEWTIIYEEN